MHETITDPKNICFQCNWFIDEVCTMLLKSELSDNAKKGKENVSFARSLMFATSKQISSLVGKLSLHVLRHQLPLTILDKLKGIHRLDVDESLAPNIWSNIQRNESSQRKFWNTLNQLPSIILLLINQKQIESLLSYSREKSWPYLTTMQIFNNSKSSTLEQQLRSIFSTIPTLQTINVFSQGQKQSFSRNDYMTHQTPVTSSQMSAKPTNPDRHNTANTGFHRTPPTFRYKRYKRERNEASSPNKRFRIPNTNIRISKS